MHVLAGVGLHGERVFQLRVVECVEEPRPVMGVIAEVIVLGLMVSPSGLDLRRTIQATVVAEGDPD